MLERIWTIPKALIRRRVDRRGVRLEAFFVLFLGLLGSIGLAYVSFRLSESLTESMAYLEYNLIGETVGPVGVIFGVWILYTVVPHYLAGFYGGRSPITRVFRVAAWSLIPVGIWYIVRSATVIYLFLGVEFPETRQGPEAGDHIDEVLALGLEDLVYVGVLLLGLLFVAWSWHLLAIGVAEVKDISLEDARKVAAVPALVFALYIVSVVLQWQSIV